MGRYLRLQVWRERILTRRYVARMQVGCIGWLDLRCHTYQNINEFWRLIGEVVGQDLPGMDCAERLRALRAYQVGLCDVVAEDATLEGGADSTIRGHVRAYSDVPARSNVTV